MTPACFVVLALQQPWMLGPFTKPAGVNPVMVPRAESRFRSPMNDAGEPWGRVSLRPVRRRPCARERSSCAIAPGPPGVAARSGAIRRDLLPGDDRVVHR